MRTQRLNDIKVNIGLKLLYYHILNFFYASLIIWFTANIDFRVVNGWLLPSWNLNLYPVLILVILITLLRHSLSYFAYSGIEEPERVLGMSISELRNLLKEVSNTLGLKRQEFKIKPIKIVNVGVIDKPLTPKDLILVPQDSHPSITREEIKALVSHEVGHIKAHIGIQHIFQGLSVTSIIVFIVNTYIRVFLKGFSEMSLIFALLWLVPVTIVIRPIVKKFFNPLVDFFIMRISHLNEHYADLMALSISGPVATINMLIHLQDWAYKRWRLSVLSKLFTEVLRTKGADEEVIVKCKSWVEKFEYLITVPPQDQERQIVLNFIERFCKDIGPPSIEVSENEPLGKLVRILLKHLPIYKRIAIRETFLRLWKWDKYVPTWRDFDKQEPFGILKGEELDEFVNALEEKGIEGVNPIDLTTLSHPTILKRIEFILSISRS